MIKRLLAISGIIMLQTFCNTSFSQNNCGSASLENAEELYSTGAFDECIESLENCLNNNAKSYNNDQKVQAYRLLALCYLAVDSVNDADLNIENLLSIKVNFEADSRDPERFKNALENIRSKYGGNIISSVSKRNENIRLAPATTAVITEQEIKERGYNDLIELLKDLPGFDISIYYGKTYANVYQRGLRTNNTEKTLILIDGVEDNDLWSNFADISQQYPITNIKRVEVIYGPASTMYGPNAFSGVINIITKEPGDYIKNKNYPFGIKANAGIGSYNTKYIDVSTGFKRNIFSFSLTGRFYDSDRPDLSSQDLWDYSALQYDDSDYINALSKHVSAFLTQERLRKYIKNNDLDENLSKKLYTFDSSGGKVVGIILTDSGANLARNLDNADYNTSINNQFKNDAHSSYINANINVGDLKLGFVYWTKNEGAGTSSTDKTESVSGTRWLPAHKYFYLNYNRRINDKLLLSAFLNYRIHTIRNESKITSFRSYITGRFDLGDLVKEPPTESFWNTGYYYEQSKQFRSEFKFLYTPSSYFYLLGGIELRNSHLQGDYLKDSLPVPQELGEPAYFYPEGGNQFDVNDVGVYAQGRYSLKKGLGFTLGLRLDHNQIRQNYGFGYKWSPRFVIDYSIKEWVFKALYSRGIENVSNFTKYASTFFIDRLFPNPDLKTESISNYEISASNKISDAFSADIDFYYSIVKNVVGPVKKVVPVEGDLGKDTLINQHIGQFKIKGIQSNLYYKSKSIQITLNYSYTKPIQTKGLIDKEDTTSISNNSLAVADIAPHKLNVIVNYIFLKNFSANLRINCVDSKKVGPGTTVQLNKRTFPGYVIGNFALTAENLWKGISLQFVCNNIFNKVYYSPGIYTADGIKYPDRILQMGRNFSFRIGYEF